MYTSDTPQDPADFTKSSPEQTLRDKAIERLRTLGDLEISTLPPEEICRRLHELNVHQIELEIQNEHLRQTQVKLDAARGRYFDLYDLAPIGYLTLNENGLIQEANLTAATLLEVDREGLLNIPISKWVLGEDQEIYYLNYKRLVATGFPQAFELRMVKKDKKVFWARLNATASHNSTDAPLFRIVLDNITERKEVGQALREKERFLRTTVETTADGFWVVNTQGKIIQVNSAYCRMSGYTFNELLTLDISTLDAVEKPAMTKARIQRIITNGSEIFSTFHRRKDGSIFPVEVSVTYIKNNLGEFVCFCRDITERRQTQMALQKKREDLQTILDSSPIMIFLKDRENRFIHINKTLAKVAGLPKEAIEGKNVMEFFPDKAQDYWEEDKEVITSGKAKNGIIKLIETPNGPLWVQTDKIPYKDRDGEIIGIIGFSVDITERKLAADRLQTLNDELEQRVEERTRELQETHIQYLHAEKLAAIGKLSASIAHEFNNPLQGIMAVLKGLKKRAILEEEDRELLDAAIDESNRMKKLIRSLQDFNRPSSCAKAVMDVQKTIDSLLLLHKSDFKNKRISVQLNHAKRLPQIIAIPDQIKQVFLNLLTNAADACQLPGGVITVSTWQEDDKVAISIQDTGIGIQPEHMGFLFQPFYTTKPEVKGTGLGLSVCHGIVKNHQGEIRVESQPGKGATFTVLLPAQGHEAAQTSA